MIVTARSDRESIMRPADGGTKGYILKPYHAVKVIGAILKLLV